MTDELPAPETSKTPEVNLSGAVLGDFLMLRRLGKGGMAEVYLAEQRSLRRQVAFKILRQDLADDPNYVQRFHHEAQAAARLVQANIVQIYEVGKTDGLHYIAQEYVNGQNLKQYLQRHGAADVLLAVNLMRQVTAALVRAADQGVTHRDIKPENIMLAVNGEVKVADFGLARVVEDSGKNRLTQVGITMGTPLYMSPEQVEGKKVDPRSDLYSFGVTCYEMLAGRPPFEGDTPLSVAVQHLKNDPEPLETIRPDLPQELCQIINKLLCKRPEDRFSSPTELLRELRAIKIDDSDDRWTETLEQLASADTLALTGNFAATQQLDALMKQQTRGVPIYSPAKRWLVLSVVCVLTLAAGASVAWVQRPGDPLQVDAESVQNIPVMTSVESQLRYAQRSPSEAAWLAVQKNFPASDSNTNQYYSLLADVQLAELYLQERNEEMALERYRKLFEFCELFPGLFPEFYPVSLVGQAVALERIDKVKNEAEVSDLVFLFNEWVISTNADEGPREPTLVSQGLFSSFRSAIERYGWNDRYEAQDLGWETL